MEAGLMAFASVSEEVGWLHQFLLKCVQDKPMPPVLIHCDCYWDRPSAQQTYDGNPNPLGGIHGTMISFFRNGMIDIDYVITTENIIDPSTKAPAREKVWIHRG